MIDCVNLLAMIDGVEFAGVKFISISPKWLSNIQFCVAQFPKKGDEGLLSSEKLTEKSTDLDDESLL
jgi:hypothetical protein